MDAVSYAHSAKQAQRIEKFIENPDSTSGIVTVPKTIASGETITIPAGRVAVLPNVQVDGTLNVEGDVFIPAGATFGDLESQIASKVSLNGDEVIAGVKTFSSSPIVPTPTTGTQAANKAYVDDVVDSDVETLRTSKSCINTNVALIFTGTNLSLKKGDLTSDIVDLSSLSGLGYNQTFQNVTASRSVNVIYTNTTGKPIQILICADTSALTTLIVNGTTIMTKNINTLVTYSCIVPNGQTYRLNGTSSLVLWSELR